MSKLESPAEKKTEHEITIEVEKVVLPQVVSIKKASELMGLPAYYLRRLCKEVPGLAFQSGVNGISLGKTGRILQQYPRQEFLNTILQVCQGCQPLNRQPTFFFAVGSKVKVSNRTGG